MFGIGSNYMPWPGFSAYAVEWDRPFLSETGYRSFVGLYAPLEPDFAPDSFAAEVITAHVQRELKGRLVTLQPGYRRAQDDASQRSQQD